MNEEQNRVFVQWLIPAGVAAVIIMVMFFNFSNKTKLEAISVYENEIISVADKHAVKINHELQTIQKAGNIAIQFMDVHQNVNVAMKQELLTSLTDNTEAYMAIYCNANYTGIKQDGVMLNLKESTYKEQVYSANENEFIYIGADGITDNEAIVLVIPSKVNDTQRLLVYYPLSRFKVLTNMNMEFDSGAFTALINVDGTIIQTGEVQSEFFNQNNLWNSINTNYRNSITKAKVRIQNFNSGCLAAIAGTEEKTIVYSPIKINEWALTIGINQEYVNNQETQRWRETSKMLYQLLGVIIIFLGVLMSINIISKVRSAEKNKQLQEKVDTDLLTGLNNKLATEKKIKDYMDLYPDSSALMFVLDIDNFKKINDTMGHAFGDEVLRCLGKQISAVFRVTDVVGRTGGDEFTIFLKNIKDENICHKEAQKLVNFFKNFVAGEYVKYSATASIGAAIFPKDGKDFETLYKSADQALYKAKNRGKNQLAFKNDTDSVSKPQKIEIVELKAEGNKEDIKAADADKDIK